METTDQATGVDPFDKLMGALDDAPAAEATDQPAGEEQAAEAAPEQTEETQPNEAASATVVDIDGKKLEIPDGTPPALVERVQSMAADLKADYTRKTQEVAEIRKVAEQQLDAIQKRDSLFSANAAKVAKFTAMQERIQQFEQLDWNALAEANPGQFQQLDIAYRAVQREAGMLYRDIQAAQQEGDRLEAVQKEKARELARLDLQKRLPNISDADRRGMLKAAQDLGATESHMYDPVFLQAVHIVAQWNKFQEQKPKALQKVAAAPVVLKPGAAEQRKPNQAAFDRLKKHGRVEDLAALL